MDFSAVVAGGKTSLELAQFGCKNLSWWQKWRHGEITITHPMRESIQPPIYLNVSGTHKNLRSADHYWLVVHDGADKYWPRCEIRRHANGAWEEKICPITWTARCSILVVRVSSFMESIFTFWNACGRAGITGPLKMTPPQPHFVPVSWVTIQVVKEAAEKK